MFKILSSFIFYSCLITGSHAQALLPFGGIATASGPESGAATAWYTCPTDRYRHGVLGDSIEAACLAVTDSAGNEVRIELPEHQVFEDITPRLADLNGDGHTDIVTIRSDLELGAALVIYEMKNGQLQELASTPPIGLAHRWLAPAGIADFNGDNVLDIAYVQTPHIGGILKVWSMIDGQFKELDSKPGFSNHSIGATRVSTSRVLDDNKDGIDDLALPDQSRSQTIVLTMKPTLRVLRSFAYDPAFYASD